MKSLKKLRGVENRDKPKERDRRNYEQPKPKGNN